MHAGGVHGVLRVPDVVSDLPLQRRLGAVPEAGADPDGVSDHPAHAHRAGGGDRAVDLHVAVAGVDVTLRSPSADRAMDAAAVALRLGDGRHRVSDAVPDVGARLRRVGSYRAKPGLLSPTAAKRRPLSIQKIFRAGLAPAGFVRAPRRSHRRGVFAFGHALQALARAEQPCGALELIAIAMQSRQRRHDLQPTPHRLQRGAIGDHHEDATAGFARVLARCRREA